MSEKNQFSKYAKSYNNHNIIQQIVAKSLIRELGDFRPKKILDLGCGSGQIIKHISWEYELFHGIDSSEDMCSIHKKGKNIKIDCCSFDDERFFRLIENQKYDIVLSSSALQWSANLTKVLKSLSKVTNRIDAVLFTSNTFKTIQNITKLPSPILDEQSIKQAFSESFSCVFETILYKLEFENKKELFSYIKKSGVSATSSLDFKSAKSLYKEYPYNYLEFEVVFVKATTKSC